MDEKLYIFGPVPSRRLGLSLGVDIVPFKVCSLDCVYCQLGRTTEKTIERKPYVEVQPVIDELKRRLADGLRADYITISGSGEPTLNSLLGEFIDAIKKLTDIPVAILTNGTLFYQQDVRDDCSAADVVVPSLDGGDEATFEKINRPAEGITIEKLIDGLCAFRRQYSGQIWLEVFFVEAVNTDTEQVGKIKAAIQRIRPDKIHLNTAVRPTADAGIARLGETELNRIANQLGPGAEVVADFAADEQGKDIQIKAENVLSMLKRRPCSLDDICSGLGIARNEALKYIGHFHETAAIEQIEKDGRVFFRAK